MGIIKYNTNQIICGCDEAGRGALAGPVVASAVILPKDFTHPDINDSKKLLWVSRSKIPSDWKGNIKSRFYRHTGFHLWRVDSLINFSNIEPSQFEISEDTHAVRMVENQFYAHTVILEETQSIDVPDDLIAAKKLIMNK